MDLKGFPGYYFKCIYSRAAAICLATRLEWSSPMPLSETFDVKSPKSRKEKRHFEFEYRFVDYKAESYQVARILV